MRTTCLVVANCLAAAACSLSSVEPIPLNGVVPHTVLVLSPVSVAGTGQAARSLLATLTPALRERGYYPIPIEVGLAMLERRGVTAEAGMSVDESIAAARLIGADAVMSLRIEKWDDMHAQGLVYLAHDIGYRLWDVDTGGLLWEMRSRDVWDWAPASATFDSSLDAYLGQTEMEGEDSPYRTNRDAAVAIHRRALDRLPKGPLD